jgi:choline kinase
MQLVLLASGRGFRLKERTENQPKCLVKINNKPLIDYNLKFYEKFNKKIIITGYRSNLLKRKKELKNFTHIKNKKFMATNMVYSFFLCQKHIEKEDMIICYSDIIFDKKIFKVLEKNKETFLPLNINWLKLWKKRMPYNLIKDDAEEIILKKKFIVEIGKKIKNKMPKYQFMGIIKLKYNDFLKLKIFFIKLNNHKIDFTNFLDAAIKKKIIKLKYSLINKFWIEIDTINDLNLAKKLL